MYEYNRWLTLEANWEKAEEKRKEYMEGSQAIKSRDDRHRERGMERQTASIEQMKAAKNRVEQKRQENLEKGKSVRNEMHKYKEKMHVQEAGFREHNKMIKEKIKDLERSRPERDALLALKKRIVSQVKVEVLQLAELGEKKKEEVIASNRAQVERIKLETDVSRTDSGKSYMYEQRKKSMLETQKMEQAWAQERKLKKQEFIEAAQKRRAKSQTIEASARLSRKELTEKKVKQAQELRERKAEIANTYRKQLAEHAGLVKAVVNMHVADKFAPQTASRRMLQHPHYQEVTAVLTDVTSHVSKEIAASPRRRLPQPGTGGRASSAPALRNKK